MSCTYLDNMELDKALAVFTDAVKSQEIRLGTEEIPAAESFGRVTSEAVHAVISSPHYNACAMDGVALSAKSTFGATDTTPVTLKEGIDFIRVDTGDPLPGHFNAVVMIEDVIEQGDGSIQLFGAAAPWQHVRQIGEDICAYEMLLPSNTRIEPPAIGALLAGGVSGVKVWKKPVVGIIPTGDEIVDPKSNPQTGEIIEFNSSIFSAMLTGWGAVPRTYGIVPDNKDKIRDAIQLAVSECDMVIINAGSSAGREDFSAEAVRQLGEVLVHGIAIRPGKPAILGIVNRKPVIGIPGYPVSGIIVMEKILQPILKHIMGLDAVSPRKVRAALSRRIVSSLKYKEFVRMKLGYVDGKIIATPLHRGAGVVSSLVKADGIMVIPLNSEGIEAGQEVDVELLKTEKEIRNTLVLIGSHDPLIDVLSDMMRTRFSGCYLSSAHVGSMGGITAIRRGEAHLAGIHLLDEETGEYNLSYIRRYIPGERICLIHCVKRIQGLMVARGNPLGIAGLGDIAADGVRYVNRQKGSGTRILLDYMLRKENFQPDQIDGYEREEFTHLSVAALVASGSGDAGLGIYSAAKAYGLDFIPVCEEVYDFILPERFLAMETTGRLLEILRSEDFKERLGEMGGYILNRPGEIEIVD